MAGAEFSPSLMCMDFLKIEEQIAFLNEKANFYHVDIMDGHFVKNLALSPDFVRTLRPIARLPMDCHLMVENPDDFIDALLRAGAGCITVHAETIGNQAFRILGKIRRAGCLTGAALNPATPLSAAEEYLHLLDKLTIMTVDPGFAGQPFVHEMLDKIERACRLKKERGYSYRIEVDGSCNVNTFQALYKAGAEVFVLGSSSLFGQENDLSAAWTRMREQFRQETGV